MKKILLGCISSVLLQNIYCASDEKKVLSFPSKISAHVDREYKNYLTKCYWSLDPWQQTRKFFARGATQVFVDFLDNGPNIIIDRHPELAEKADGLQQEILSDKKAPIALLINDLENKRDLAFWRDTFDCLCRTLNSKVNSIKFCSSIIQTLDENPTPGVPGVRPYTEQYADFTKALIVIVRFMELTYQQNPDAFEALLKDLY